MNILIINAGSTSLKFQLFDGCEHVVAKGGIERIGLDNASGKISVGDKIEKFTFDSITHQEGVQFILSKLAQNGMANIDAIGHRVVHGGYHSGAELITSELIGEIRALGRFAPKHNPIQSDVIQLFYENMPTVPQVAYFDTAFHQTMQEQNYTLPVHKQYQKWCRRWGAHGINYDFVTHRIKELCSKQPKMIVCHLGGGASLCAIDENGKSVKTTMGLSPTGGLIQLDRSGDIDPAVIQYLAEENPEMSIANIMYYLNYSSGLKAITGGLVDFRDICEAAKEGNKDAKLACDIFYESVAEHIFSLAVANQGSDAIVFTAGIGENSADARKGICDLLSFAGVELDASLNLEAVGKEMKISTSTSSMEVWVIPANEELQIRRETVSLLENL